MNINRPGNGLQAKVSNTQRKKQKRMAKQGKTTGSFMGPKLATLMHRGFMINMQPSVAATAAAAMSLDGPWRLYNDQGLIPGSECPTESLVLMLAREREETGLAGTNERTMAPWRQDGIGKCLRLVASSGDAETPEDKVFETLQVGYRLAYGDERMDVCLVMSALLAQWQDARTTAYAGPAELDPIRRGVLTGPGFEDYSPGGADHDPDHPEDDAL